MNGGMTVGGDARPALESSWASAGAPHPRRAALGGAVTRLAGALEHSFAVAAVFLLSGALVPLLVREGADLQHLGDGHPVVRGMFYAVYAVMLLFLPFRWRSFLRAVAREPVTVVLVALAAVSTFWSFAPDVTFRRAAALALTTAFGWYLAVRFPLRDILRILALGVGATLLFSLGFGLLRPDLGIATGYTEGAWQGVFLHKNILAKHAALGGILFALLWRSNPRTALVSATGLLLSLGLLFLSRSQTGIIVLATLLALLPVTVVLRWRSRGGAPVLAGILLLAGSAAVVVASNLELALAAIGRETTLTGRTALWSAVVETGAERPLLGAGYSAFWLPQSNDAAVVRELAGWDAGAAHNGFLDLWLELGVVGVVLFVVALLLALRAALRLLRVDPSLHAALPIILVAFVVLSNLSEGGILRQNNLVWVLFVTATAASYRAVREAGRVVGEGDDG